MKKISMFLIVCFVVVTTSVFSQIKVLSNGKVGLGTGNTNPGNPVDILGTTAIRPLSSGAYLLIGNDPTYGFYLNPSSAHNGQIGYQTSFQDVKEQSIQYIKNTYGEVSNESLNAMQAWYAVGVPGACSVNIENQTINNSSQYAVLDVGDCSLNFSNVSIINGTNTSYNAGMVTINANFDLPLGASFEIK